MELEFDIYFAGEYGHWKLAVFQSVAWTSALYVFIQPRRFREMLAFTLFALFLVIGFVELSVYPFTLFHVFGEQLARYPTPELLLNNAGDLWRVLLNQTSHQQSFDAYFVAGGFLTFGGFVLLYVAWRTLRDALESGVPATSGPYLWARHPQYLAVISIMLGNLVTQPTIFTLLLLPLNICLYLRLARLEEQEALARFGNVYADYMKRTPAFFS
jgi:protein-S-isoprenylcysteine O-methyltransferase Ste14